MALSVKRGTHGRGVFTDASIAAGSLIIRFTGPPLRHAQTTASTYALQVGPDLYIGASGGPDDYINHSCEPNAGFRIPAEGPVRPLAPTADLYAIRDIAAGEEVLFDYSTTLDEDDFTMECRCGAPSCRGTIRDGKYLPEKVWQRYEELGILPGYVRFSRLSLER
jgi:uncharacterized protein